MPIMLPLVCFACLCAFMAGREYGISLQDQPKRDNRGRFVKQ